MAEIKGVVFDKDGTLFSFNEVWGIWCERVLHDLCADEGQRSELAVAVGYNLQKRTFVAGSKIVTATADEINQVWADLSPQRTLQEIEAVGLRHLENLPLAPVTDLQNLIDELKVLGLQLGVATNDFESVAHSQLAEVGIADRFDFICGSDSGYGSKPDSGMIEAFCRQCNCSASEVAMVGDSTHDLHAGSAAGAALRIGVLTGPATRADLESHADVVLTDISELPEYLRKR